MNKYENDYIEILTENLKTLAVMYNNEYRKGTPTVPDEEYDAITDILETRMTETDFDLFMSQLNEGKGEVGFRTVIGSQKKIKAEEDTLYKWLSKENITQILAMDKLNGMSIVVQYHMGHYVSAYTRGNGYEGKIKSEHIRAIVPNHLNGDFFTGQVRGEVIMADDVFVEKYQNKFTQKSGEPYEKSMPAVAGAINEDVPNFDKLSHFDFVAFEIIDSTETRRDQLGSLKALGFDKTPTAITFNVDQSPNMLKEVLIDYLLKRRSENQFDIDGLVICDINWVGEPEVYYPTRSRAFKLNDRTAITKIKAIEWVTGKTGVVIPVVILEPVRLLDTTVTRVSAYNAKFVIDNKLYEGMEATIVKGGDIIPVLVELDGRPTIT